MKKVQEVWVKLFNATSRSEKAKIVCQELKEMIPEHTATSEEVCKIHDALGRPSDITEKQWISRRSTKLYFKYRYVVHNIMEILHFFFI